METRDNEQRRVIAPHGSAGGLRGETGVPYLTYVKETE